MFKPGDWVHTQHGIGQVTLMFPCYYQFWEKIQDDAYRAKTYGEDEALADRILGKRLNVGECQKYIMYMKRLCDHDGIPKKRISGFHAKAYKNDKATRDDLRFIKAALKDNALKERFEKFEMKYPEVAREWSLRVPKCAVDRVCTDLHDLSKSLGEFSTLSVNSLYHHLKSEYGVDLTEFLVKNIDPNLKILTHHNSEASPNYYNSNNEEIIRGITAKRVR